MVLLCLSFTRNTRLKKSPFVLTGHILICEPHGTYNVGWEGPLFRVVDGEGVSQVFEKVKNGPQLPWNHPNLKINVVYIL